MVTKHVAPPIIHQFGSVLAKIFMVTKHMRYAQNVTMGSVLAKIFMVTKHDFNNLA